MFHGSIVAIVTPMQQNGDVDREAMCRLIEFHIENQTDGIVVVGSTGESATLNAEEKADLIRLAVKQARGRLPIIAGTGAQGTRETIEATRVAMELGVDACLLVTPYYNRPTQEGLFQHFSAIANAVPIPQILYNVPGRTACDLLPETVARLAPIANIVGLKEATGKLERVKELLEGCGRALDLYSGDDPTALDFMLQGGKGVISVTANVAPRLMHQMSHAALNGAESQARELNQKLMALHTELFCESNPIPSKWALAQMGLIKEGIRLPLTPLTPRYHEQVLRALQQAHVLSA